MPDSQMHGVVEYIRGLVVAPDLLSLTDSELLKRFLAQRDEGAFEALVRRHGPMVLGLCRRVLREPQDAEDAFQAAFLVLVRKAASIAKPELLGNWLYGPIFPRWPSPGPRLVHQRLILNPEGAIASFFPKKTPPPPVPSLPRATVQDASPLLIRRT